MYKAKQVLIILSVNLLLGSACTAGTDYYREYNNMISESKQHQSRFQSRHKDLCRQVLVNCEKKEQQGDLTLSSDVPLFKREGYHFNSSGILQAQSVFKSVGKVQGYYKIKVNGQQYYLLRADVEKYSNSQCKAMYNNCLSGKK